MTWGWACQPIRHLSGIHAHTLAVAAIERRFSESALVAFGAYGFVQPASCVHPPTVAIFLVRQWISAKAGADPAAMHAPRPVRPGPYLGLTTLGMPVCVRSESRAGMSNVVSPQGEAIIVMRANGTVPSMP